MFTLFTLYYISIAGLVVATLYRIGLMISYRKRVNNSIAIIPCTLDPWPSITIQVPVFNERLVIQNTLHTLSQLIYDKKLMEIQILDDSTDITSDIIAKEINILKQRGINIKHIQRNNREGFKAGALAQGLKVAKGELIVIFDADFLPAPNFLQQTLPYFKDPSIGAIQTRWSFLNRNESLLTRAQAIMLDAHFEIEQNVKSQLGFFLTFNGTAGIWRKKTIDSAGGWKSITLTEDLDLSFRAQMRGWKIQYLNHVEVPSELPSDFLVVRSQQHRWAKGSSQTFRSLIKEVILCSIPLRIKLEAVFHLARHYTYACLLIMLALAPWIFFVRGKNNVWSLLDMSLLFSLNVFFIWFFLEPQKRNSQRTWKMFAAACATLMFGISFAFNNTFAALEGLFSKQGVFVRTPKKGSQSKICHEDNKTFSITIQQWLEFLYCLYLWIAACALIAIDPWIPIPFYVLVISIATYPTISHLWLISKRLFPSLVLKKMKNTKQDSQIQRKVRN